MPSDRTRQDPRPKKCSTKNSSNDDPELLGPWGQGTSPKVKSHFTLRNSEMGAVAQGLLFNTSGLPENIPVLSKMSVEANQLLCWGTTDLNPTSFSYLIENLSAMAQIISNTSRGFTRTDKFRVSETLDDEAWIDSIVSSIFLESMVR